MVISKLPALVTILLVSMLPLELIFPEAVICPSVAIFPLALILPSTVNFSAGFVVPIPWLPLGKAVILLPFVLFLSSNKTVESSCPLNHKKSPSFLM